MEIASARDWIIVIVGALEIIFIIALAIVLLIIYNKVNHLIKKGKETAHKIQESISKAERTVTSPYFKIGAFILRAVAAGLGGKNKKRKEEKVNGR